MNSATQTVHSEPISDSRKSTSEPPRRKSPRGSRWTPYLFLGPAIAYIAVFQFLPLMQEIWLSFTDTTVMNPQGGSWVGLDNYERIISSADFQRTLLITLVYVVVCVVGAVGVGLGVAILLNGRFRGRSIARALVTIPWAAPGVAIALIFTWMLNAQYGVINHILEAVHLGVPDGNILDSTRYALVAILLTTIWQLFPFSAIVLLSSLQSVPKEVVEAAAVDGAGKWWTYRVATWPVIRPTVFLLALLTAIWSVRRFELIWLMTRGGPLGSTKTLVIDLYQSAFELHSLGRAAAVGIVGIVICLLLVAGSFVLNRGAETEASS